MNLSQLFIVRNPIIIHCDYKMRLTKELIQKTVTSVPKRSKVRSGYVPSAVLMLFFDRHNETHLVYIRRTRGATLHSGQMAFPGGKQDFDDPNITLTALREAQEELGLAENDIARVGRLSDVLARPYRIHRQPMVVTPLVFEPQRPLAFTPNYEVAEVVWVPLSLFLDEANRRSMSWEKNGIKNKIPTITNKMVITP